MGASIDLTGCRFERLLAIEKVGKTKDGNILWKCKCDCGKEVIVKSGNLRSGHTRSCGCLIKEWASKKFSSHRESKNRLYNVWNGMKRRCYNTKDKFYKDYGGRGIKMCDDWRQNFTSFRDWALSNGYDFSAPKGKCTIDRIDVNGNYEPSNCRWVDMVVQRHNRRDSKNLKSQKGVF